MNTGFITTEVFPFAKVGGLGDVSSALPLALKSLKEEVTIFMPLYSSINKKVHKIRKYGHWKTLDIAIGDKSYSVDLFRTKLDKKVNVLFISNEELFNRSGLYTDENGQAFEDNHIRDIFFSKATLEVIKALDLKLDILHLNDSHTALVAPYLKLVYNEEAVFENTKTVLTIHNIGAAYQGICEAVEIERAGFSYDLHYLGGPLEFYGKFNFLKAGIVYADMITTVSPKYAQEIQTPLFGEGLDGLLVENSHKLVGILNGIDTDVWNPKTDKLIEQTFTLKTIKKGKTANKKAILKEFGLKNIKKPLVSMISRLTTQKGFDLLTEVAEDLSKLKVNVVILGTGEKNHEKMLSSLMERFPETFSIKFEYNDKLAHLIEAGSDMFLMPSKYEPCGLNQMYSLAYGTVPVVKAVGGLDDTIIDVSEKGANGFKFTEHSSTELLGTLKSAVKLFNDDKKAFTALMKAGLKTDLSWKSSAKEYVKIYKNLHK